MSLPNHIRVIMDEEIERSSGLTWRDLHRHRPPPRLRTISPEGMIEVVSRAFEEILAQPDTSLLLDVVIGAAGDFARENNAEWCVWAASHAPVAEGPFILSSIALNLKTSEAYACCQSMSVSLELLGKPEPKDLHEVPDGLRVATGILYPVEVEARLATLLRDDVLRVVPKRLWMHRTLH